MRVYGLWRLADVGIRLTSGDPYPQEVATCQHSSVERGYDIPNSRWPGAVPVE